MGETPSSYRRGLNPLDLLVFLKQNNMTKEEKKEYGKAWRAKNADKVKADRKKYNDNNRDKIKAYNDANKPKRAAYKKANKKRIAAREKVWQEANKDRLREYKKQYQDSSKTPFNIVYCIPDYDGKGGNYAGVTNNPHRRMLAHKNDTGKLNTENWFILDVVIDRGEALISESRFHVQGYDGDRGWRDKK